MPAHLIAEEGPVAGLLIDLEKGTSWIIGRDPDESDFVIEDSTVSRKHAQLTKMDEGVLLENLSHVNPVLVNDEEIEGPYLLKEGDWVQIGNSLFLFSEDDLPDLGTSKPPKKKKKEAQDGYNDIFGDLEEPTPPPHDEPKDIERETIEEEISAPKQEKEETIYDTIFEDGGEEGEIPFPLLSQTPLLLKVVSGPNAGAEIGIEKGRSYVIGKDAGTSDIVFQDLSVSRNHARLTVNDEGILELEDLGSKNGTLVSGVPILEKQVITPQDLISVGTTVFLIIDREAPQETIYSPMMPTYESPKANEEAAAVMEPIEEDWKKKPLPMRHLVLAGSFLVVFLIVFLSFFSLFKSEQMEIAKKEPSEHIQEAIAKFHDVKFSYNPASGKLFLVGHVLTTVEYQELMYRIGQMEMIQSTENNVVIDELVWKMTNDVLSDNPAWRGVSIQSPQAGKFTAMGYLQTNVDAALLSDYLTVNFPYLDRLQNEVIVEENLNVELQGMLNTHGFGAVTYQVTNGEVVLAGKYSEKMQSSYDEFVKQIHSVPGVTRVKNYAIAVSASAAGIDLSQQYDVGGSSIHDGKGYSVVLNGKMYTLGDMIDGLKITSIASNSVHLEKDGIKYRIDYAR